MTWLYGPLHTAVDAVPPPRQATANERLGLESLRTISDSKKKPSGSPDTQTPDSVRSEADSAAPAAAAVAAPGQAGQAGAGSTRGPVRGSPNLAPAGSTSSTAPPRGRARSKKPEFHAKPILKYRSLSDILLPHGQPSSPEVEATGIDFEDQSTISVHHARSDSHLVRLNSFNRGKSGGSGSRRESPIHSPMSSSPERTGSDSSSGRATHSRHHAAMKRKERRHISFNHRVEQCIAIDSSEENRSSKYSTASSSDEDEDDVLTFGARSPRLSSFMRPGAAAAAEPKEPHTIARLGPTTLKSTEMYPAPSPAVVFSSDPTEYDAEAQSAASPPGGGSSYAPQLVEQSDYLDRDGSSAANDVSSGSAGRKAPQTSTSSGRRVIYDYSTAESQARSQWDVDDDDYAMGFDYFTGPSAGPDVGAGDEYDMAQYGSTHLIGGRHNNYGSENGNGPELYLGSGPYSPTSPYHPGSSTLEPAVHATATQIPHYRDTLNASAADSESSGAMGDAAASTDSQPSQGPYAPPVSVRDAAAPKRSAMKGGRSRDASVESAESSSDQPSSAAPSPPLSSLSSSPTGIQAVATAVPAHVRPGMARRGTSEEGERGRSASRGSSSSLEREASAARRNSSTSISPAAYSPPVSNNATGFFGPSSPSSGGNGSSSPGASAKPIAIDPMWKNIGSYESLDSIMSGSVMGTSGSGGGSTWADRQNSDSGPGAYGMGRIITSSSVDSMGSLGSFGAGPVTPTSPTFASPTKRFQPPLPATGAGVAVNADNDDDDDDDDKLVEDVDAVGPRSKAPAAEVAVPAAVALKVSSIRPLPARSSRSEPILTSAVMQANPPDDVVDSSEMATPMNAPSTQDSAPAAVPEHVRPARLRNPSPSSTSTAVVSDQAAVQAIPQEQDGLDSSGPLKRSTSSSSLSFARQSLLRASRDREESSPRSSLDLSEQDFRAPASASPSAPAAAQSDELGVGEGGVGSGLNVAGTARDLFGALSKGLWGSLGGGQRQNSR